METSGQFSVKFQHLIRATIVIFFIGFVVLLPVAYNNSSWSSTKPQPLLNDFQLSQSDSDGKVEDLYVPRNENGTAICLHDCSHHGTCVQNGTKAGECRCDPGYVGMNDGDPVYEINVRNDCSYKQKSKQKAFLLSFFLGIYGAERYYLDYVTSGTLKLLFTLLLCMIPCFPLCCLCCIEERRLHYAYSIMVLSEMFVLFGVLVWWIVDWSLIVSDAMKDGNGVKLFDDM